MRSFCDTFSWTVNRHLHVFIKTTAIGGRSRRKTFSLRQNICVLMRILDREIDESEKPHQSVQPIFDHHNTYNCFKWNTTEYYSVIKISIGNSSLIFFLWITDKINSDKASIRDIIDHFLVLLTRCGVLNKTNDKFPHKTL